MSPQTRRRVEQLHRLLAHQANPDQVVDAATLLRGEADRLRQLNHKSGINKKMAWAYHLAAARLDAAADPAMLTQYQKVQPRTAAPSVGCSAMKTSAIRLLADLRQYNPRCWKALCDYVGQGGITDVHELADDKLLVNVFDGVANKRVLLDLNSCSVTDAA